MEHHLIVHKESVNIEVHNLSLSEGRRMVVARVQETIEQALTLPHAVEIPNSMDPGAVPEHILPGDSVLLYGAYHGMCLSATYQELVRRGVRVAYHPGGYL